MMLAAGIYSERFDYHRAISLWEKCRKILPNRIEPVFHLMVTQKKIGNMEKAAELARKIIAQKEKVLSEKTRYYKQLAQRLTDQN